MLCGADAGDSSAYRPRKVRPDWNALATIWTISDELWDVIAPILAEVDPPRRRGGRGWMPVGRWMRSSFGMRSGCQWNQLPERFPDDSSVHRTFQRWVRLGLFERLWATLVAACDGVGRRGLGVASGGRDDGQGAAGGDLIGRNPTDRGKRGVKRSLLVEAAGGPLAVVIAGANVP